MSTPVFREVRLEIVRPGKPHNQLLSPLTPYVALCGEGSPITFYIDFEQQQLLNRLEQLRYVTRDGAGFAAVPSRLREAQVIELGQEIARILNGIDTLSTELARAQCNPTLGASQSMVHLRIVLSGSELAMIPFEIAIAPLAYPGEGLELSLQAALPIAVTREIRHAGPVSIAWNRKSPKILIIYAEPDGLRVPAAAHIQAVRASLEPWIRYAAVEKNKSAIEGDVSQSEAGVEEASAEERARLRLKDVKRRLRVLPNASIEQIYKMCSEEKFTHVHILAHGDTFDVAGNTRFGLALCRDGSTAKEVVSGKRLVKALQAEGARGESRSEPLVVTLATCDSGNQATLLVPGGSIAHDLHVEGIPWVFASQFPLTMGGSVRMAEILYPRLFRGDDPRQILFEMRRQLYQSDNSSHDWASLVVYAALPRDFDIQVAKYSARQIKEAVKVLLDHADRIAATSTTSDPIGGQNPGGESSPQVPPETKARISGIIEQVKEWLNTWEDRAPKGDSAEERERRGDIFGMHGSTYKRLALLPGLSDAERRKYYTESRRYYRKNMEEGAAVGMNYYWSATQFLALEALLFGAEKSPEPARRRLNQIFELARNLADRDTTAGESARAKAWAHATLAELELIRTFQAFSPDKETSLEEREKEFEESLARLTRHCKKILDLEDPKSFAVGSTYRQLKRYVETWAKGNEAAMNLAKRAIEILNPKAQSDFDWPDND